jgi:putative transposase
VIEHSDRRLSVRRQCSLLGISRSCVYYRARPQARRHAVHHDTIRSIALVRPFYGYRKVALELRRQEIALSEKQVRLIMRTLRIRALRPKRNTSIKHPQNLIYPYLLRDREIRYPNQVWCTDLTYIKLPDIGHVYLAAIMDVYSRKVLSWRISNSMDSRFCEEALKEALAVHGVPAIFNTDQGSQFTSNTFTGILQDHHVRISMDGRGRWADNVHIERLWRTVKYEEIYLRGYDDLGSLRRGLRSYFEFYNRRRFHQNLDYQTPDERYASFQTQASEA